MKKLLLIIFLFPAIVKAQDCQLKVQPNMNYKNTLYATFTPTDLGVGVRYDFHKFYASVSTGTYYFNNTKLTGHYRFCFGRLTKPSRDNVFLLYGVTYNIYGHTTDYYNEIWKGIYFPLSFELGSGIRIKRFSFSVRMDVPKFGDSSLDFGINF
jgi:hypothetical protein